MAVTEGFIVMIPVLDGLGTVPVFIGHKRSDFAEPIPEHGIVHVTAGIWLPAFIELHRAVTLLVDLILVIETLKQGKPGALQRFPGLMVVFIKLDVIIACKFLLMAEYLEGDARIPGDGSRGTGQRGKIA